MSDSDRCERERYGTKYEIDDMIVVSIPSRLMVTVNGNGNDEDDDDDEYK